jgi:Concanavalin A-like lectin/glucanases superfamily
MTDWVLVLVPLLVLPIVLLFRFVGCEEPKPEDEIIAGPGQLPSSYKDTIKAEPSLLAYWRLVDAPNGTKAKVEKSALEEGALDGEYVNVPAPGLPHEAPDSLAPGAAGSEAASGNFGFNQTSLIANEPPSTKCRSFNGGYVVVAGFAEKTPLGFGEVPYLQDFTIEAWISPQWTQPEKNYEHTLIHAGGNYQKPLEQSRKFHGFRIFADRKDEKEKWRVYLANEDGSGIVEMKAPPIVAYNAPTHLAVTVETVTVETDTITTHTKKVTMFVNGKPAEGTATRYSPPDGVPLFIGVDNTESDPSKPHQPRHPILSPIQEVVLYNKALSSEVIKKHHDIGKGVA